MTDEEIIAAHQRLGSMLATRKATGASEKRIRRLVGGKGRGRYKKERHEGDMAAIIRWFRQGDSLEEIAERIGASCYLTIYNRLDPALLGNTFDGALRDLRLWGQLYCSPGCRVRQP